MIDNAVDDATWEEVYPKFERLLEGLTTKFINTNNLNIHINKTREDFLQEARIAAFRAMQTYDKTKKTKLTTHVVNCVNNRFIDLRRVALKKIDLLDGSYLDSKRVFVGDYGDIDHAILMESILTPEEHDIYLKIFVFGYTPLEVAQLLCRKMGGKVKDHRKKVNKCSLHICLQYKLNVLSHKRSSIWKRLIKKSKKGMLN